MSKFEREEFVNGIPIAPAERYIAEVRFDEPGAYAMTNTIQAINHFRGEFYPHVDTLGWVSVSDKPAEPDYSVQFDRLRQNKTVQDDIDAYQSYFDKEPDHELELSVEVKDLPIPIMLSMEMDTLYVPLHGQRYLVLSIDGVPTENRVWKDTSIIPVGSTIDLLVDMTNPGDWMMHCHIAEHLEAGMMLKFSVEAENR